MLIKVISGGQTGADQAGLVAAKNCKLKTGGFMPKGFRTDEGDNPSLGKKFNLEETSSPDYPFRTRLNVANSAATIIFGNPNSPGCKLTIKLCNELNKPYLKVSGNIAIELVVPVIVKWMKTYNVNILNVAGNREKMNLGIFVYTKSTLQRVFRRV